MNERTEFITRGEEILGFVEVYGVLRCKQLEKFFPDSQKIVGYLLKNRRLYKSSDKKYISAEEKPRPEKCLLAALGVLADLYDKVQSHAKTIAPAQISFFTHTGDYYEIIYVGFGMDAMVSAYFDSAANRQSEEYTETPKRIVIVENKSQMERLLIPGTVRYALVQPDGSLSYYKGS